MVSDPLSNAMSAIKGSDLIFLATEWNEFLSIDWRQVKKIMQGNTVVDGRNVLDKAKLEKIGFRYYGFGV